ncbi:MAG TPA: lasso peptide biosynthesis B2 protein [Longimicrobiaceae bacterium]|jgi:hypothetical protein|nr:lasso peptide biosynthesis B2 protein [Longimicrobiaceae bacterium]
MAEEKSVEDWLLGRGPVPDASALREAGLAAYAHAVLPDGDPVRVALRSDYYAAALRHQRIKRALLPLLRAWSARGIEVLLFKGFHLAEMAYESPGTRIYSDVDLLVRPERADEALRVAHELGWLDPFHAEAFGQPHSHTLFTLFHAREGFEVDVHRLAVHATHRWSAVQEAITDALWAASRERQWEGIAVREPTPVDSLLVGLVLQRCWGDAWQVRARDFVDVQTVERRAGAMDARLRARAAELRCSATLEIFLSRCDPGAGRLSLGAPSPGEVRRWRAAVARERPGLGMETLMYRLLRIRRAVRFVPRGWLELLHARRALAKGGDLRAVLARLTPPAPLASLDPARQDREAVQEGVRWAQRVFPGGGADAATLRSLALYAVLRRQGWPVVFVRGLPADGSRGPAHAWIELDGRVPHGLGEPDNRRNYRVDLEFPEPEMAASAGDATPGDVELAPAAKAAAS